MRTTIIPFTGERQGERRRSARGTFLFEIGRVYAAGPELRQAAGAHGRLPCRETGCIGPWPGRGRLRGGSL